VCPLTEGHLPTKMISPRFFTYLPYYLFVNVTMIRNYINLSTLIIWQICAPSNIFCKYIITRWWIPPLSHNKTPPFLLKKAIPVLSNSNFLMYPADSVHVGSVLVEGGVRYSSENFFLSNNG
jgi:hypothetical protein